MSKVFDLMRDKPTLDGPTLNWVWDTLWRFNAATRPKNAAARTRINERARLMDLLETEAAG